jgi:hypothetical protein
VALPSPAVVSSARLNRYYDHLPHPSGWLPLPGSSTGDRSPRSSGHTQPAGPGRASPVPAATIRTFPSPLRRGVLHGCASRLFTASLAFALPLRARHSLRPTPRMGPVTTRQASLHVTDRSVAHPQDWGARRWASTPPVSRRSRQPATGPPGSYPDRTYTGKRRRAYDSVVNHSHDQPPIYWTHSGTSTRCSSRSTVSVTTCGGRWTNTGTCWTSWSPPGVTPRPPPGSFASCTGLEYVPPGAGHRQLRSYGAAHPRGDAFGRTSSVEVPEQPSGTHTNPPASGNER